MSVLVVASNVPRAALLVRWSTHFGRDESNLRWWAYSLSAGDEEVEELEGLEVEFLDARDSDPVNAVLELIREHEPNLLIVEGNGALPVTDLLHRLGDRLLRFAACDVMVLDPGVSTRDYCASVVVPMERPFGAFAVRTAARIAGREGVVKPLVIGSKIGLDAEAVATKELELDMGEAGIEESESIQPVVALADRRLEGLCQAGANADLLLVGASAPHLLSEIRASGHLAEHVAVGLVRPGKSPTENRWRWLRGRLIDWLPKLRPEERTKEPDE